MPTNLANTCVQGGSSRWGLTYVSPTQINAVAGAVPASGTVPVSVVTNCGQTNELATAAFNVTVAGQAPEFLYFVQNSNGQDPVAVIQALSGAYVGPPNLIAGATFTPARANDVLTAFGVGWGPTDPAVAAGSLAPGVASLAGNNYSLTIGGVTAQVLYAGITPSYAGLYQVNFVVPTGLAPGSQPIVLTVNGVASPPAAFLTIGE